MLFLYLLVDTCHIHQRQIISAVRFQTGEQRVGSVDGSQTGDSGLHRMTTDDETILASLDTLRRRIKNQINLMSENQIQQIRTVFFYLIDTFCRYSIVL